jgi:hypothetical protein
MQLYEAQVHLQTVASGEIRMIDDKSEPGGQDRIRINVSQPFEVRDWCNSLGCTEQALRAAVKAVGPMAGDVRTYLATQT